MNSSQPLMRPTTPDFARLSPSRSPGILVGVILVHAGILAMVLTIPRTLQPTMPAAPLYVRLIEPVTESLSTPAPPKTVVPPPPQAPPVPKPPVQTVTPPAPRPEPAPQVRHPEPVEPAQSAPLRAESTQADIVRPEVPPAPAPTLVAPPRPAPPPPPLPITQPRFNADYLDNPKPPYPSVSRRMGEEGEVQLRVSVDPAGNVQQIEIHRSSGFARLDQAALETVRRWRFVPARQGNQAISSWVIVPIQFSLRS